MQQGYSIKLNEFKAAPLPPPTKKKKKHNHISTLKTNFLIKE